MRSVRGSSQALRGRSGAGPPLADLEQARQEPSRGEQPRDEGERRGPGEVAEHRRAQTHHPRRDERAEHGAAGEEGVEDRHDRAPEALLDGGTLVVHRDVPQRDADGDDEDRGGGHCDVAQDVDGQPHREQSDDHGDDTDHHRAGGADGGDDPPGQRQGEHRPERTDEQGAPQLTGREVELLPDRGDARGPRREGEAAHGEGRQHGVAGGGHVCGLHPTLLGTDEGGRHRSSGGDPLRRGAGVRPARRRSPPRRPRCPRRRRRGPRRR
ncbi:hypothetical protein [Janibacter hoylei]|uniref:hypothetical protein n=1 Tax=Janibacter hoylei TaxID=364298 RepID=UPI001EE6759A|nr:hypothetical protein [Janibacter hoylei]